MLNHNNQNLFSLDRDPKDQCLYVRQFHFLASYYLIKDMLLKHLCDSFYKESKRKLYLYPLYFKAVFIMISVFTRFVASTSIIIHACGISVTPLTIFCAIALRTPFTGIVLFSLLSSDDWLLDVSTDVDFV